MKVLQQRRPALAGLEGIIGLRDRDSLIRRQDRARALVAVRLQLSVLARLFGGQFVLRVAFGLRHGRSPASMALRRGSKREWADHEAGTVPFRHSSRRAYTDG